MKIVAYDLLVYERTSLDVDSSEGPLLWQSLFGLFSSVTNEASTLTPFEDGPCRNIKLLYFLYYCLSKDLYM